MPAACFTFYRTRCAQRQLFLSSDDNEDLPVVPGKSGPSSDGLAGNDLPLWWNGVFGAQRQRRSGTTGANGVVISALALGLFGRAHSRP
jgi:hypothetical protein